MVTSLVAGAAGFLGSNLSQSLLAKGHKVVGVDDLSTGTVLNLKRLEEAKSFTFIKASVTQAFELPENLKLDFVYHLASPASPPKYQKLGLETLHVNTVGTENLIQLAIKHSARFLFASTSEVYGDPLVSPQREDYWGNVNPVGPRSIYDESKRLGETLVYHFVKSGLLNGTIVRIFNTYGPGMDPFDGRVVSTFIRQALAGEPFTVFGSGGQTRSFCYVDDLIRGITALGESELFGPLNLGNPREIDLISLGQEIAKVLDVEPSFEFKELPQDDPQIRQPDITKAILQLGWEPEVDLPEGISRTAEWMKLQLR
jgi:nucleoside-diphosphate-sugar epimerase